MNLLDERKRDALAEQAIDVIDQLAFAVGALARQWDVVGAEPMRASVEFTGSEHDKRGVLFVAAGRSLMRLLAGNALGRSATPAEADDLLRELAEILAGRLLPTQTKSETELFSMTLPQLVPMTDSQWADACQQPAAALLDIDGEPMLVWMNDREAGFDQFRRAG